VQDSGTNGREPIDQASAVPYQWRHGRLQFCLITSIKRGRWVFPKGIIDPGETYIETALKEAQEEAGLDGQIVGEPLGTYSYAKWGTTLNVTVALMQVEHQQDQWEESDVRQRRWVSCEEALELLAQDELRDMTREAIRRLRDKAYPKD
jgi:8-oxo-dGTP pyrophosphatase MutT (NUDIX family)